MLTLILSQDNLFSNYVQYWPIYYGFKKINKYLKNWMTHRKKFSVFGRGTNMEKNAKNAAFNFEICGRR